MAPTVLTAAWLAFLLAGAPAPRDEADLVRELLEQRESADPARLVELAGYASPQALSGLLELLPAMESVYMRREVLRAVALLLGDEHLGQPAAKALLAAVREELSPHLRRAAAEALAQWPEGRKGLLAVAGDDDAREQVRLEALRAACARSGEGEAGPLERLGGPRRGRSEEFRATALCAALPWASSEGLLRATRHDLSRVRMAALETMVARGDKRADDVALRQFEERDAPIEERLAAGRTWLARRAPREGRKVLVDMLGPEQPEALALGIAETIGALAGAEARALVRLLKDADERELRILLRALRPVADPAVAAAFVAALGSSDPRLVREAADGIAARRQQDAAPALERLLESDRDGWLGGVALESLSALRPDEAWTARLLAFARDPREPIRCGALHALEGREGEGVEAALVAALDHPEWSTRLAALRELERRATPAAVGAIVGRLAREDGRLRHELADALWRLTGQPLGTNAQAWAGWWKDHAEGFRALSAEELARRDAEQAERELRRTTSAAFVGDDGETRFLRDLSLEDEAFFGLQVVSHRVVFMIDVSASMDERLEEPLDRGRIRTRLELASSQLARILGQLDAVTRFRIVSFSGRVASWSEELRIATPEAVAGARAHVLGLQPAPGTNVYDGLRLAFADEAIDTVYVISDGEPTAGDVQDGSALRAIVREWNRLRGIEVHCISIGPELELLRGLARDSGGAYLHYR